MLGAGAGSLAGCNRTWFWQDGADRHGCYAQRCAGGQNVIVHHDLVFRQQEGASVSVSCKYKIAPIFWSFPVPAMPFVPE